ncbi:hypothetical protein [Helicobacter cinaedi]|uniref:hypothetical protein n=1 Tax=Helicobacter cinaedi TaxID=213 RepID=UPI000D7C03EF|nr:hypothetical protein [Helicobacter cinaedi]
MIKQKVITHNNIDIYLSAEMIIEKVSQSNEKSFCILVKASGKDFSLVQLGCRRNMDKTSIEKACETALLQAEADLKIARNKEYYFA